MIINEYITIKIIPANKKYWETKLNLSLYLDDEISVKVLDLPEKSNIMIDCICDNCNRKYQQRRSRDLSVCGYCKTVKRMKNNNFGSKNSKYKMPSKEELEEYIQRYKFGKVKLAKKYGVSIPVINSWLEKYDIKLDEYYGRLFFKTEEDYRTAVDKIERRMMNKVISKSQLSRDTNIPIHIIRKLEKELEITLPNKFTKWKYEYDKIVSAMEFYQSENQTKTLKQISEENSISIEQLKKAFRENNIKVKSHSYNKSKGELECRDFIRDLGFKCDSYMFEKKYEIDCYVNSNMFGLEYCGEYWHRYCPIKNNKNYHIDKLKYFTSHGIKLMTIFESEWNNPIKQEIIKSMIRHNLKHTSIVKVGARKCNVSFIDKQTAQEFHKENHISGSTISSYDIGLTYNGQLLSVLSLVKSRFDKKYDYEISRFSTKLNHNIAGGFSKMFQYAQENITFNTCLTYSDLRFGTGKVYEINGFRPLPSTVPNYFYYDKNVGILENRMKYQKSKLNKMNLKEYADDKNEFQIMSDMGYYKIYDCGNNKYVWERK